MGLNLHQKLPAKLREGLRLAILLPASAGLMAVCFGGPAEKVEFSDTGSSAISTNAISSKMGTGLSHLSTGPSALRQIQDDLFSPLASPMDPLDSMQGVFNNRPSQNQQPQSPAELRRIKRQNDKRKNWAFANMNVLEGTSAPESDSEQDKDSPSLSLDGHDKKSDSVIEQFVNGKGGGATNQAQTIEWYNASGEGRDNSFSAKPGGPHAGNWGQAPVRDFFGDDQGADRSAGGDYGFHNDISPARAAADFSAVTRQRDAFREILNAPSGASASSGSGLYSGRSSASSFFSTPSPAATAFSPPHTSVFSSGDSYGSGYSVRAAPSANPASSIPSGPLGNSVNSPAAVQQLLDPYTAIMKKPTL